MSKPGGQTENGTFNLTEIKDTTSSNKKDKNFLPKIKNNQDNARQKQSQSSSDLTKYHEEKVYRQVEKMFSDMKNKIVAQEDNILLQNTMSRNTLEKTVKQVEKSQNVVKHMLTLQKNVTNTKKIYNNLVNENRAKEQYKKELLDKVKDLKKLSATPSILQKYERFKEELTEVDLELKQEIDYEPILKYMLNYRNKWLKQLDIPVQG